MKRILAIDGNSIINRAYFGVRPLTNSKGQRTEAIFGMLNMILSQREQYSFDLVKVAFDLKAPTFRHKMYEGYKSNRHGMDEELRSQLAPAKSLLSSLGYEILSMEGYEADDILGTVSKRAEDMGDECYVFTGDRDSLQLISDKTKVLLATKGETVLYDRSRFFEKYGINPEQFVDAKALMGDTSDCIPGVPGIGEKTAMPLIARFGSLENLYNNLEDESIKTGVRNKLRNFKESADLSRTLSEIYREVPVEMTFEESEIDREEACKELLELGFSSFISRLGLKEETKKIEGGDYKEASLEELLKLKGLLGVVLHEKNLYVAAESGEELVLKDVMPNELFAFFTRERKTAVYDSKTLERALLQVGIPDFKVTEDPMLGSYVLSSTEGDYSFKGLCLRYLETVYDGEADAKITLLLSLKIRKLLEKEELAKLYDEMELPLSSVLARMEDEGFLLDREGISAFSEKLEEDLKAAETEIYELAGEPFNINSPKQLGVILFEKLGLPVLKKTKSGYSTNAEVLEKLQGYHEIVGKILDYRQVSKLHSTYTEGLLKVAGEDNRVHTSFTQTVTATGRLSSVEPNLQNIPVRTELGRELRRFFMAGEGKVLIDADYSQIELRILSHIAEDERMIEAFKNEVDIHAVTASQVFGTPIEEVTSEMRKKAKAVNFGIVYGISDFSLSGDIHVTKKQAAAYIDSYFKTYPGIHSYMNDVVAKAKKQGYVETMFGRKRKIPELSSGKAMLVKFGERVAMNSPIQGTAADVIKIAMIHVDEALKREKLDAKLILQVHDELILESSFKDAERAAAILKNEMEHAVELKVPLTVDLNMGKTWYECK